MCDLNTFINEAKNQEANALLWASWPLLPLVVDCFLLKNNLKYLVLLTIEFQNRFLVNLTLFLFKNPKENSVRLGRQTFTN